MPKPIDRVTWARWRRAQDIARREGRDLAEVLNQEALLFTRDRFMVTQAIELRSAAQLLETVSPAALMAAYGRTGNSALDMQRAVVSWLRDRADLREKRANE